MKRKALGWDFIPLKTCQKVMKSGKELSPSAGQGIIFAVVDMVV